MVKRESSIYLLVGQDSLSKDTKLKKIKQEFLKSDIEQFNFDVLYAKELNLKGLQEKLLCLPVKTKKRIIVIKNAEALKEEIKKFIFHYVKNPYEGVILILDINAAPRGGSGANRQKAEDEFIEYISKYSQVYHFKETAPPDTFMLSRYIDRKQPDYALRLLNQLLKNGERPERILGGLRYVCEREVANRLQKRKRLKLILNCDIDIKTGRLKSTFALEKLVVSLSCLS